MKQNKFLKKSVLISFSVVFLLISSLILSVVALNSGNINKVQAQEFSAAQDQPCEGTNAIISFWDNNTSYKNHQEIQGQKYLMQDQKFNMVGKPMKISGKVTDLNDYGQNMKLTYQYNSDPEYVNWVGFDQAHLISGGMEFKLTVPELSNPTGSVRLISKCENENGGAFNYMTLSWTTPMSYTFSVAPTATPVITPTTSYTFSIAPTATPTITPPMPTSTPTPGQFSVITSSATPVSIRIYGEFSPSWDYLHDTVTCELYKTSDGATNSLVSSTNAGMLVTRKIYPNGTERYVVDNFRSLDATALNGQRTLYAYCSLKNSTGLEIAKTYLGAVSYSGVNY
jgi:hypothetical protein